MFVEAVAGIEPARGGFADPSVPTSPHGRGGKRIYFGHLLRRRLRRAHRTYSVRLALTRLLLASDQNKYVFL